MTRKILEPSMVRVDRSIVESFFAPLPIKQGCLPSLTTEEVLLGHRIIHSLWRDLEGKPETETVEVGHHKLTRDELVDLHLLFHAAADDDIEHSLVDSLDGFCDRLVQSAHTNIDLIHEEVGALVSEGDAAAPVKEELVPIRQAAMLRAEGPDTEDIDSIFRWLDANAANLPMVSDLDETGVFHAHTIAHQLWRQMIAEHLSPDDYDVFRFHRDVTLRGTNLGMTHMIDDVLDETFVHEIGLGMSIKKSVSAYEFPLRPEPQKLAEDLGGQLRKDFEAKLSMTDNAVSPGRFLYMPDPQMIAEGITDLPVLLSKVAQIEDRDMALMPWPNGKRVLVTIKDSVIGIQDSAGVNHAEELPSIIAALKEWQFENGIESVVLDAFVTANNDEVRLPASHVEAALTSPTVAPEEVDLALNIFDIMFVDGVDVHEEDLSSRLDRLSNLRWNQISPIGDSTISKVNGVAQMVCQDAPDLSFVTKKFFETMGVSGVVLRSLSSTYPISQNAKNSWVGFKPSDNESTPLSMSIKSSLNREWHRGTILVTESTSPETLDEKPTEIGKQPDDESFVTLPAGLVKQLTMEAIKRVH